LVLAAAEQRPFAATYRIECDAVWRVKVTQARLMGVDQCIDVTSDGSGHWRARDGALMPQLDGAIDVDVSVTPFSDMSSAATTWYGLFSTGDAKYFRQLMQAVQAN
jgi:hypothetical protein